MRFVLALLLSACSHPGLIATEVKPIPVAIVAQPKPEPPIPCWLSDPPRPPDEIETIMDEDDIVRRVFVHIRQYNEAIGWMQASVAWMADLKLCLQKQGFVAE